MKKALTPHPGEHLLKEFMQPYGLSSNALARALLVTPARINEIVRGKRGISADTALRLARFFNCDVQMWMDLQNQYELGQAELLGGEDITRIAPNQQPPIQIVSTTKICW